jgi:hypothetical protein
MRLKKIRYQPHKFRDYWAQHCAKRSYKRRRREKLYQKKLYNCYIKKVLRDWQSRNNGILPDLSNIPEGYYCYHHDSNSKVMCQYYRWIEIPETERDNHVGIVAVGQTGIAHCNLINRSDDDMGGFGLLWDECKECPFKKNTRDSWCRLRKV